MRYIFLKIKLLEETQEALLTNNIEELNEELADVLEVIKAISKLTGDMDLIKNIQENKREFKGGFDKSIFVEHVCLEEDNEFVEYYCQCPDKYPEVSQC